MLPSQPPALRQRIGRHVLLSLVLIWALGSAVVLAVGNHFVAEAFDRALLDDAHALAAHVRGGDSGSDPLRLDLTPREAGLLRFDQSETVWFAVYGPGGAFVAGDRDVAAATAVAPGARHAFAHRWHGGQELRSVSLRLDGTPPFTVVMAQTTAERALLLRRLLVYSGLAQLWLLVALGSWLLRGIERDLRPLAELQDAVDRRDAADLQPLPQALTQQAGTRDVRRLGEALDGLLSRVRRSLHAQREFAGDVAHELRTPLAGIRAQAAHALAQNDPAVWRSELEGILTNLLDNALRYASNPAPRITVALLQAGDPDGTELRVTDNGPGMDDALAHSLQQRWAQGDQGLRLGHGAGLGLSIVARYAQLMGGRLTLSTPHGQGLIASVWLPCART